MPKRLSFKEALERQGDWPVERRVISGSPVELLLSMPGEIPRPVTAIQTLASFGTSLHKGSETIDRIAKGETVPIELTVPDDCDVVAELGNLGVHAKPIARPTVDIAGIRERLALTQAEFAIRFGLELDTLRNWEQGRNTPDPAAMTLLKIIAQNPAAVDAALAMPVGELAAE